MKREPSDPSTPETQLMDLLAETLPVKQMANLLANFYELRQLKDDLATDAGSLAKRLLSLDPRAFVSGDLLFHLARLQFEQVKMVCDFSANAADRAFRDLRRGGPRTKPREIAVVMSGSLGRQVIAGEVLRVPNRGVRPGTVSVIQSGAITDHRGNALPAGETSASWGCQAIPDVVPPGRETSLRLQLTVEPPLFSANQTYYAEAHVLIGAELAATLEIEIHVLPEEKDGLVPVPSPSAPVPPAKRIELSGIIGTLVSSKDLTFTDKPELQAPVLTTDERGVGVHDTTSLWQRTDKDGIKLQLDASLFEAGTRYESDLNLTVGDKTQRFLVCTKVSLAPRIAHEELRLDGVVGGLAVGHRALSITNQDNHDRPLAIAYGSVFDHHDRTVDEKTITLRSNLDKLAEKPVVAAGQVADVRLWADLTDKLEPSKHPYHADVTLSFDGLDAMRVRLFIHVGKSEGVSTTITGAVGEAVRFLLEIEIPSTPKCRVVNVVLLPEPITDDDGSEVPETFALWGWKGGDWPGVEGLHAMVKRNVQVADVTLLLDETRFHAGGDYHTRIGVHLVLVDDQGGPVDFPVQYWQATIRVKPKKTPA